MTSSSEDYDPQSLVLYCDNGQPQAKPGSVLTLGDEFAQMHNNVVHQQDQQHQAIYANLTNTMATFRSKILPLIPAILPLLFPEQYQKILKEIKAHSCVDLRTHASSSVSWIKLCSRRLQVILNLAPLVAEFKFFPSHLHLPAILPHQRTFQSTFTAHIVDDEKRSGTKFSRKYLDGVLEAYGLLDNDSDEAEPEVDVTVKAEEEDKINLTGPSPNQSDDKFLAEGDAGDLYNDTFINDEGDDYSSDGNHINYVSSDKAMAKDEFDEDYENIFLNLQIMLPSIYHIPYSIQRCNLCDVSPIRETGPC
ncbi:hypothetical protein H4Q26_014896 [Puccinia striiformis f. sp. tritici PST-130]|nr:hypothetical protein H4Q26_014896 [Puccinia striiformis f. sp. tritici PST-130]